MSENKRTWSDKIKLVLNELEGKMSAENADTARIRKRKNRKRRNNKRVRQFRKKECLAKEEMSKTEMSKAEFKQDIIMHAVLSVAFLLATIALVRGIVRVLPNSVSVSNSVNGRELPIYCVETDKKQIALSFDAAWGNCK